MTLVTAGRVFAGVDDELASPAAARDVQARRTVARFTAGLPQRAHVLELDAGMGAARKDAGDAAMAIGAGLVPDKRSPWDRRWRERRSRGGGTRIHQQDHGAGCTEKD